MSSEAGVKQRTAGSVVRYTIVSSFAFVLDLAIVLVLRKYVGMPVWAAAAVGYLIVASAFYFVHEHYTFADGESRSSARRMVLTVVVSVISLAARVGVIWGLEVWREPGMTLTAVYVAVGAAVSMTLNYLLNRFWVFDRRQA